MGKCIRQICAMFLVPLMMLLNCPISTFAAGKDLEVDIQISHDPVREVEAGKRIPLQVEIENDSGVEVVRAYFKGVDASEFSFIVLETLEKNSNNKSKGFVYSGMLPAPANKVGMIDYLILIKNGNNQVVQTQTYRIFVKVNDTTTQESEDLKQIHVYTELLQSPAELIGFSDNITITTVKPQDKLGVVAGIYSTANAGESQSNAVAVGTVPASSPGLSKTALAIGGGAVVLAVGLIAAIAGGGGGSGGGDSGNAINSTTILGTWNHIEINKNDNHTNSGTTTFASNGRFTINGSSPGTWSLSGKYLTLKPDHTSTSWTSELSGNSQQFIADNSTSTVYFTR